MGVPSSFLKSVAMELLQSIASVTFVIVCIILVALVLVAGALLGTESAGFSKSNRLVICCWGSYAVVLMYSVMF